MFQGLLFHRADVVQLALPLAQLNAEPSILGASSPINGNAHFYSEAWACRTSMISFSLGSLSYVGFVLLDTVVVCAYMLLLLTSHFVLLAANPDEGCHGSTHGPELWTDVDAGYKWALKLTKASFTSPIVKGGPAIPFPEARLLFPFFFYRLARCKKQSCEKISLNPRLLDP